MSNSKSPVKPIIRGSLIQTKTPQDEEAEQLYQIIIQKQRSGYELSELIPSDNQTFELIRYILLKPIKLSNEIYIIKLYLFNLDKFMNIFKTLSENTPIDDLITKIGGQLKCEFIPQNKIICKQGDKGDKCYVVFKGTISILIQKEYLTKIFEADYVKYLIRLCLYSEYDLMNRVLLANRTKILIEERDIVILMALFRIYKYYLDFIGTRFKFLIDFVKGEKEAEEIINEKYECNIASILHFFPLDGYQLNEVFDYFEQMYSNIIGGIDQKISPRKGSGNNFDQYKHDIFEAIINNNDNSMFYELIYNGSSQDYCERFAPLLGQTKLSQNELKLFTYVEVVVLKEGNIFGDVALQKVSQKRTATVITKTDCIFGTLTKTAYDLCLKGTQDKVRLWNVYFFLNGPLFKEVNQTIFESKYFNFFKQEELKRGQRIFNSNENRSSIYFIKQGEFEVSSKLTFKQLNHIIRSLGGYLDEEEEKEFASHSIIFDEYYNRQCHFFRFCFLKDKEIAGLDDFMIKDKYFCDCYCSSSKVNVFSLEEQFYFNIIADKQIKKNIKEYVVKKRKVFLDLLLSVRQVMLANEINKITKDEKELSEHYYNQKKKIKMNKVKTTNSIVSRLNLFNRRSTILQSIDSTNHTHRKNKSGNGLPCIQITTSNTKIIPTAINGSGNLSKISLYKKKHHPINEKIMSAVNSKNQLSQKLNSSLTKLGSLSQETLPSPRELQNNPVLMNRLNKTMSLGVPLTIFRMKKVILPKSTLGYKEYTTVYTESRSIRTDTFFYNNLHVFNNILNQKCLSKAKRGYIDCLILDKWEENNSNSSKNNKYNKNLRISNL